MKATTLSAWLAAAASIVSPAAAQTYTSCNPLSATCPADPALGKSINIDFTSGASDQFTSSGSASYDSNGAAFSVAKSGDSPTIISKWYMMFGKVEVVMKPAHGVGIVSTMVLQSDDLDEIDWEWLGADNTQVQSNYFGKGQTTTYNRGAFHPNPGNQDAFHTYSVEFTSTQIVWQIDGVTVRVLTPANANSGQYPQTPMQLKLGIWSGGDPSNPPGTIQWAGGATNYANGPFTMHVKSVQATDYSTGSTYTYGDMSGSWQSIKSNGGSIGSSAANAPSAPAPSVTAVSGGSPLPFDGTHSNPSSTFIPPSIYPWVAIPTTLQTSTVQTTIPGLPSGWTVSASGKVVPPSAAPSIYLPAPSTSSPVVSPSDLPSVASGFNTLTTAAPSPTAMIIDGGQQRANGTASSSATLALASGAANTKARLNGLGALCGILVGVLIL